MSGAPPIPLVTAITGEAWEGPLVSALEHSPSGVSIVRRCVDIADLLATAAAGHARAALLSADLRRLDREALDRLAACDLVVVGVVSPGDDHAERRLRQLGVRQVVTADAAPEAVVAAVDVALRDGAPGAVDERSLAWADPAAALAAAGPGLPELPDPPDLPSVDGPESGRGRLVAVWGPTGAPGRTSLSVGIASEVAALGVGTVLADADTYGGAVAQWLGLQDDVPGLAAAARTATAGRLDVPGLARHARQLTPRLRVLTGLARADRWPELRPSSLEAVWAMCRILADVTVVDCGFCLEQDEEISFDTLAPRRNGATLMTLSEADAVVVVGSADPVGMQRLVRAVDELRESLPGVEPRVVLNRVRRSAVGRRGEEQLRQLLAAHCGITDPWLVPDDRVAFDTALMRATVLGEVAPESPAREAIARLGAHLAGRRVRRGRWARRRMSFRE